MVLACSFAMDGPSESHLAITLGLWVLIQILSEKDTDVLPLPPLEDHDVDQAVVHAILEAVADPTADPLSSMQSCLHSFCLCTSSFVVNEELGFWVKPRSTAWFSQFLMQEYDDQRWVELFRMKKCDVLHLSEIVAPQVRKKDTRYRATILVIIRVACTLFKLSHGVPFSICLEMFAIGKSTVCALLRDVVHAINKTMRYQITWPTSDRLRMTQEKFSNLCGLPSVVGAIDGTHVAIAKPQHGPMDYFYFKSGGYSLNCQAVVDTDKRFLDLYLGMPGSTNDARVLRRSTLFDLATHDNILSNQVGTHGFTPYLLGDLGYPLMLWLMVPHRGNIHLSLAETLFNIKLRKGRCVVKNAFGILKQTFRELSKKTDLQVAFLPDVIVCCAILHNTLFAQSKEDVQNQLGVIRNPRLGSQFTQDIPGDGDAAAGHEETEVKPEIRETAAVAAQKQELLGMHLTNQRPNVP